ncbi:hypothetical protein KCU87_g551, partial [Aureobasidium melanogenum]
MFICVTDSLHIDRSVKTDNSNPEQRRKANQEAACGSLGLKHCISLCFLSEQTLIKEFAYTDVVKRQKSIFTHLHDCLSDSSSTSLLVMKLMDISLASDISSVVKDLAAKFWKSLIWCRRFARVARDGRCTKKHADASSIAGRVNAKSTPQRSLQSHLGFSCEPVVACKKRSQSTDTANESVKSNRLTVTHPMFCTAKSKLCFVNDTKYWMHYIEQLEERKNARDFLGSKKSWRTRLLVLACDLSPIFKSRVSIAVDALLLLVVGRLCTEIIKAVAFTSVARFEPIALSFLLLTRHTCFSHSLTALRFGSHPYGNRHNLDLNLFEE